MSTEIQMCNIGDIIGGEPCLRVAQHVWHPEADDHPVYLCNFHAEPFAPFPQEANRETAPASLAGEDGDHGKAE